MDFMIALGFLVCLVVGLLIGALLFYWLYGKEQKKISDVVRDYEEKLKKNDDEHRVAIEKAKLQSVQQSRVTLKGKAVEQLAPLLPGFTYLPADSRFIGDPIDYLIFDGYSSIRDRTPGFDGEVEIIIADIKQGESNLSYSQKAIVRAIEKGRVRFEVIRVSEDGEIVSHAWYAPTSDRLHESGLKNKNQEIIKISLEDLELYSALKRVRSEIALQKNLSPQEICHSKTLIRITNAKPIDKEMLLGIDGVSQDFVERYSGSFLDVIKRNITNG